jgi:hypothetical protein
MVCQPCFGATASSCDSPSLSTPIGGPLGVLGSDTAEVLEVKTVTFTATRHIRRKQRCSACSVIVQAAAMFATVEAGVLPIRRRCGIGTRRVGMTNIRSNIWPASRGSCVVARVLAIACCAHVRRKWFDLYETHASPLAREALDRIGQLCKIETVVRGQSADQRRVPRQNMPTWPRLSILRARGLTEEPVDLLI